MTQEIERLMVRAQRERTQRDAHLHSLEKQLEKLSKPIDSIGKHRVWLSGFFLGSITTLAFGLYIAAKRVRATY